MPSVLIADDHSVLRAGLRRFLRADPTVKEIGESETGAAALAALSASHWDLVILDIGHPEDQGVALIRQVRAAHPTTRVLALSTYNGRRHAISALHAGAGGFLARMSAADDLQTAVRTVCAGRRYVTRDISDLVSRWADKSQVGAAPDLSRRERQILIELARGRSIARIAADLGLSAKTISTYRARLLLKLGVRKNAELTAYALRNGLID
jgi:two-component system, NarL family, invasion response regulator UvrY